MLSNNVINLNLEEAYTLIKENKDMVVIDVKSKNEYQICHIPNAILMPVGVIS